ncbi:PIM1 kinase, partial [Emberiza fucata]|nr:PIM1 kinase [Emberiza fucata]
TGKQVYSPPEGRIIFLCYHGHTVMMWSLAILLYDMVCRFYPLNRDEDIILGHYLLPAMECQHLVKWCQSICSLDRPSLEDLFNHSWLQE